MRIFLCMAALTGSLLVLAASGGTLRSAADAVPAPAFTHPSAQDWLNSPPLTLATLDGTVVLIEFWTFACHNCNRSIPWLNELYSRLKGRGLQIVSVHTPEFDHEKVRANVQQKVGEYGIAYPVMLDNDYSYWKALSNQYWPAFYLVDKRGRVRAHYAGETHRGDGQARRIEGDIEALLSEPR